MRVQFVIVLASILILGSIGTVLAAPDNVWINEIHYDNVSLDTGEAIEIAGTAGIDLSGWSVVLYNGGNGASYDTIVLSGVLPTSCTEGMGVLTFLPTSSIQNGGPDGIALVDNFATVIQFLSYEGSFTATDGPANGMMSEDIGVSESTATAVGDSLQLTGMGNQYSDFSWATEQPNTFGACNTGQNAPFVPAPVITSAVWDDVDNADGVLSADDTLTITFDSATNRPGGTGTLAKGIVDNLFTFANSLGTDYTGVWTSTTVFTIIIVDATGATASLGDTVSAKGTLQFTGTLDTTGGTAFSNPQSIATNSTDFIFVGDTVTDIIQIFNPDGTYSGVNFDTTGGTAFLTTFGIATNSTDFIFVVDDGPNIVQIFNPDGTFAGTLDNTGGTPFVFPHGIATNSTGFIFVSDIINSNVEIFNPDGTYSGENLDTAFSNPREIATNSTDFIFVGDIGPDIVRIFNPDGTFAGTLDTTGGTAFLITTGIATNSTDHIFVGDTDTFIVQIFNPDGTFAGVLDTTGATAFVDPVGIATNSKDDIFVVDVTTNIVQRFSQGIRDSTSTSSPATGGTSTTGNFGVFAPVISSAIWNDADNVDEVLSAGDTLTIIFDRATNRPGGTGTLAKGIVDNLFSFENGLGTDYTGTWTSTTGFTITIVDATGATASLGETVSAKGTLQFTGTLDTTGGTAFTSPRQMATNSTDHIFVGDTNDLVQIFNTDRTFAGALDTTGGTAFSNIFGIATNSTDFIFVGDTDFDALQIFNPDGTFAGTVDTTGGTPFGDITSIAINSTDFIFVSDTDEDVVQIFNPDGTYSGSNIDTTGGTPFDHPSEVATNSTDFIFVSDFNAGIVQIFNPAGSFAGTVDTNGGTAFGNPSGVGINGTDHIFVGDPNTDIVQIFNPDATFAGTLDTTGGTAFTGPFFVSTNGKDDVFVSEPNAVLIQIFSQGIRDSASASSPATGGTSTAGDFGIRAPVILSAVWDDADNSDEVLSAGDTLTLTFDIPTDRPGGTGTQTKAYVDSMFGFENSLGTDYTGQWTSSIRFVITIVDATGTTATIGDDILRSSGGFIRELDTTGGTAFSNPTYIATNSTNFIFVVDGSCCAGNNVQIFNPDGTFAGALDTTGGTAFGWTQAIAINSTDHIFVADRFNANVQIFNPDGTFAELSTSISSIFGLAVPTSMAINSTDFIFVSQNFLGDDVVQIFNPDETSVGSLDTTGGTAFAVALDITINSAGLILVADIATPTVQTFNPDGTFAGALDNIGGPTGVTTNSTGFIFVGDTSNLVQIFNPDRTFAGVLDTTGGTAFSSLRDPHIDNHERVLVSDSNLNSVQIFGPTIIKNSARTSAASLNTITSTGNFGIFAPVISSAVWDDVDNTDEVLSAGDTLTITFDSATNLPGGTGTLAKGIVDNLFTFANSIGTNYTGVWTSTTVFTITIVDATDATASIGDAVSAKGTLQFTGELDATGSFGINNPNSLAINSTDYIFEGNTAPPVVQIFNPDGTYSGSNIDTTGGTAFTFPASITTNSTDHIFVSDITSDLVQIFNPDGTYSGSNIDTAGGTAFSNVPTVVTNSTDFIFVSDIDTNLVQIFNPDGTYSGSNIDTTGGTAFDNPTGVAINSTDFIFVGDFGTDLVQIFNPDGTFAGALDTTGGTAFTEPRSITTNSTDHIFVSEPSGFIVQIFNPDGTFAGTVDTTGGTAFSSPSEIAINSRDDLFVPDFTNDNVQRFSQGIRDSTSASPPATAGTSTTGNFGEMGCLPPGSGDWIITSTCKLASSDTAPENVIVRSNSVLIIQNGLTLDIDFVNFNLTVESGSGVLIESGGAIN